MESQIQPVVAFLPCRSGSERVPQKNIRKFCQYSNGLLEIKLKQLIDSKYVTKILLSTNDDKVINYAASLDHQDISIHKRDDLLSLSSTATDDLIPHVAELIPNNHILWTHVTSICFF